jgi:hypothetical protein
MQKIVAYSNHGLETVSEFVVCSGLNTHFGPVILKFLNDHVHNEDPYYFKLVDESYKLYVWEP